MGGDTEAIEGKMRKVIKEISGERKRGKVSAEAAVWAINKVKRVTKELGAKKVRRAEGKKERDTVITQEVWCPVNLKALSEVLKAEGGTCVRRFYLKSLESIEMCSIDEDSVGAEPLCGEL